MTEKTRQMSFQPLEDGSIKADFGEGVEAFTFTPAAAPESLFPQIIAKGVMAFLQGRTSKLQGDDRTPETLRTAIVKGWEDLMAGVWVRERAPGAPAEESIEVEAAHLYRVKRGEKSGTPYTGTLQDTAAAWEALTDAQREMLKGRSADKEKGLAAIKANALYASCYAEVKAARAKARAEKLAKKAGSGDEEAVF